MQQLLLNQHTPFPSESPQNWVNAVRIRHSGGLTSWCCHLQTNGVIVQIGREVNEDPEFQTTGAEVVDETLARITLTYAANPPVSPTLPPPTPTNIVKGAWK